MVALRTRSKGAELAPFGLAALFFMLGATGTGYQDLGAWIAPKPSVSERWRERLAVSPFGAAQASLFNLPRPVGTHMPEPVGVKLASFGSDDPEVVTGAISGAATTYMRRAPVAEPIVYPAVDRAAKGDFLGSPTHRPPVLPDVSDLPLQTDMKQPEPTPGPGVSRESEDLEAAARAEPPASETAETDAPERVDETAEFGTARLYFDGGTTGIALAALEPWAAGEEPILMLPRAPADAGAQATATARAGDPIDEIKEKRSVSLAGRGENPIEGRRPKTPAEHLGLVGKARAKAERCLANAVYFEARSEPVRGQIAVAQVVLNRAFSSFYPEDVCGVVYQNANRHLSCQFTFACDGIPDVVTEPAEWERAKRIARETLDGKLWIREVNKATHYHASYVFPYWVRSMRKMTRIGLHAFYRPRNWGDGSDEITWGNAVATAEASKTM